MNNLNIKNKYICNLQIAKKICYFGSSVSFMKNGWRKAFHENLCRLTGADHEEIDSTLGGTNIVSNSILVEDKVCRHNPDIVFFDFVINDKDGLSCPKDLISSSLEDCVKRILYYNSNCIIVFLYMHSKHANGYDWVMKIYDDVAEKYKIPSINIENYIHNIDDGHNKYFKDSCHPNEEGIDLIANFIMEEFNKIIQKPNEINSKIKSVKFSDTNLSKKFYKMGEVFYQDVQSEVKIIDKFSILCLEMIIGPETKGMITTLDGIETVWNLQDAWTTSDRVTHKIIYYNLENKNHEVVIKPIEGSKLYLIRYFLRDIE